MQTYKNVCVYRRKRIRVDGTSAKTVVLVSLVPCDPDYKNQNNNCVIS